MAFNENSRVKIPAILHLLRLGYSYISLKGVNTHAATNIFEEVFIKSLLKINNGLTIEDAKKKLDELILVLDNEDLGKSFYEKLIDQSGIKLIDFKTFKTIRLM